MKLTLRELRGSDLFKVARIVGKLDIKDKLSEFTASNSKDTEEVGTSILGAIYDVVVDRLPEIEKELNAFLAELADVEVSVINELPLKDYLMLFRTLWTDSGLQDFFKSTPLLTK